jgi:hypothetical protein
VAIARVQSPTAANGSGTSVAKAFGSNVTAGSLLVAFATTDGSGTFTFSSTGAPSWANITPFLCSISGQWISIGYCKNAPAGATTVTCTFGAGGSFNGLIVSEYSGADAGAPLDVNTAGQNLSSSSTPTDSPMSATGADLVVSYLMLASAATISAGSGFTIIQQDTTDGAAAEDQILAGGGSIAPSFSLSSAQASGIMSAAFKATSNPDDLGAGGGGNPAAPGVPQYMPTMHGFPAFMAPWHRPPMTLSRNWGDDVVVASALTGDAATTVAAGLTADGSVATFGAAACTVSAGLTAAGVAATSSGAATTVTAALTASGTVGVSSSAATTVTAALTATGTVGVSTGAASTITAALTATGTANAGLSSGAATTVTAALAAAGTVATAAGAATTVTATVTASGVAATSTGAATTVTAGLAATGTVGKSTGATSTITATLTATGTAAVGPSSGAATTVTATFAATGTVGRSSGAATTITATLGAVGAAGKSGAAASTFTINLTAAGTSSAAIIPVTVTGTDRPTASVTGSDRSSATITGTDRPTATVS